MGGGSVFGLISSHQAAAATGRSQLGDERNTRRTSLGLCELGAVCHFLLSPTHKYSVSQEDFFCCCSGKSLSCFVFKKPVEIKQST